MAKNRRAARVEIKIYSDTDPDLYTWITGLDIADLPHGGKTRQIRDILLAGLRDDSGVTAGGAVTAAVNLDSLADTLLAQLRPVVEAAVTSALQGLQLSAAPAGGVVEATAEDDAFADLLFANLTLEG